MFYLFFCPMAGDILCLSSALKGFWYTSYKLMLLSVHAFVRVMGTVAWGRRPGYDHYGLILNHLYELREHFYFYHMLVLCIYVYVALI